MLFPHSMFSNDEAHVLSGSESGKVHYWAVDTGDVVHTLDVDDSRDTGDEIDADDVVTGPTSGVSSGGAAEGEAASRAEKERSLEAAMIDGDGGENAMPTALIAAAGQSSEGATRGVDTAVLVRRARVVSSIAQHPSKLLLIGAGYDGQIRVWR